MRRCVQVAVVALAWLAIVPSAAHAQASIAGLIKDTSGAVFPGVTVEAASPALIERTRSAITDGTGQYKIENLWPGARGRREQRDGEPRPTGHDVRGPDE